MSALPQNSQGLYNKPIRFYVEESGLPWLYLTLGIVVLYVGSVWVDVAYLTVVAPLVLVAQVVAAIFVAYIIGVRKRYPWPQVVLVCMGVGYAAGVVSALAALVRFHYAWLVANVVVEPVWSALVAGLAGLCTFGFFRLPRVLRQFWIS